MANEPYRETEEMEEPYDDQESVIRKVDHFTDDSLTKPNSENIPLKQIIISYCRFKLSWLQQLVLIAVAVCFLSIIFYSYFGLSSNLWYVDPEFDQVSCETSFEDIKHQLQSVRKKFPAQHLSLWAGIISGLFNLMKKPVEPAVYLLAFDKNSAKSSYCIAEIITTLATKILLPCEARKWSLLNGTELSKSNSEDPGDLIEAISKDGKRSQIVIVPEVHKIPAKLARGFHSIVDTYETMSKKVGSVYIFTIMVPRLDDLSKITSTVEDILSHHWKDLDQDELQPLVTRISHHVLPILKEEGTQTCPLKIDSTTDIKIP